MRKRLSLLLLALMPLTLFAKIWKPQEVPMTHLENKFRYVCNPDSILRESTVHYCDSLIRIIEDETGAQFVVVVVESLDGDDPYEFNKELFELHGFGQADKDNGLLLTLATVDRSYFFSTGSGMEGVLPDALTNRMQNAVFVPRLKESDWDGAIRNMVTTVFNYLLGDDEIRAEINSQIEEAEKKDQSKGSSSDDTIPTILFLTAIAGGAFGFAAREKYKNEHKNCPFCKSKHSATRISKKMVEDLENDKATNLEIWKCSKCGNSFPVTFTYLHSDYEGSSSDDDYDSSSSSSSSSSSGGSFGGGSYSGGGSGGRF